MPDNTPVQPKDKSTLKWLRDAGYRNLPHFMMSYCLKFGDDDDLDEAKAIIAQMREEDQRQWEAEHANTGNTAGPERRMLTRF
jgi:hypothetical protein